MQSAPHPASYVQARPHTVIKSVFATLFIVLLFCGSSPLANACCAGDIRNSIRKLQELEPNTTIARVRIDSAWKSVQGAFLSHATVIKHFYGQELPRTFTLTTGALNFSIIGTLTRQGEEYLIYTLVNSEGQKIYGAMGGCDMHSLGPLNQNPCNEDYDGNLTDRYQVVTDYLNAVRNKYNGGVEYLRACLRIQILANLRRF